MTNKIHPLISKTFILFLAMIINVTAQTVNNGALKDAVSGLKLREIGPALMGGRIADIAVSATDKSTWYVAVGSGGVWKTTNSGVSWNPIFDEQPSYSIGTLALDPNNHNVVWVGSGENVSGRHVGWGDGVYKSNDGGVTWLNMGLKKSEHIGKILIDPRDSNVVLVAAEGPLWSSGGDRGVYKTIDGGESWNLVLKIDKNTGVTDIEFDPSNPDVVYAAGYQRRRHTWSLLAGGPKSSIYKSIDNGESWREITTGLPKGDMGKIGLAVSPANPELVYATIEANDTEKGFYRSMDKGESWTKQNSYISGGTGPHYYQEIEVSPQNADLVYQMDVFLHVTRDGGKRFDYLGTGREKHSDNHALWIDPDNGKHLLAGTDGGLYETFDEGTTWRHFSNLPISQFYKLALDNAEPFYNIVGGAQDLGTLIGPSRTMNTEGVRNQDWYVPLGADGYDSAFDPEDSNIVYMEIQQGLLHRLDRRTEEVVNIQPQGKPGDVPDRWNWDSPFLISPHDRNNLYFGSQRIWQSKNKGDSWVPVSKDLTTNTNRYELQMMDRLWSIDALYDAGAMSKYSTLTAISESPLEEGVLYTGSDDGLIQISEDGGQNWRKSKAFSKVPQRVFINDIEASQHDKNTVYTAVDAHKLGDFNPYLFISNDRGRSWRSISGDLPKGTIVWVIKQDYIDKNLLFIGTEYGIYFSVNHGVNWIKLDAGVPTIPFRDIELHERDGDLVGASFGRGFYVLDDYAALRNLNKVVNQKANALFPVRDAWWYMQSVPMQAKGMPGQGTTSYRTENPSFGAVFNYYLNNIPKTSKEERKILEKSLREKNMSIPFPGWDDLEKESNENETETLLLVSNENNEPIRWIKGSSKKGLHRVNWDLRLPPPNAINLTKPEFQPPWAGEAQGPLAAPGNYKVELFLFHEGVLQVQGESQSFKVKPVHKNNDEGSYEIISAFQKKTSELSRQLSGTGKKLREAKERIKYMKAALLETPQASQDLFAKLNELNVKSTDLQKRLSGDWVLKSMNESTTPSIASRVGSVANGNWKTTQKPTETQKLNLEIAQNDFNNLLLDLKVYFENLQVFETMLESAGAPYTPGRKL